jgi:hypothetical protein
MYLILMKLKVMSFALLIAVLFSAPVQARFPEFGFCPLGGPPGWFNRMTGQHHRYYAPPVYPWYYPPGPRYGAAALPPPWMQPRKQLIRKTN